MAVSWPFDSIVTQDGDGNPLYSRAYSSDVLAGILSRYFRNGVFANPSGGLQVLQNEGMTVLVKAGAANINGRQFWEESDRVLAVQAAHASLDRMDTVVLRLNLDQSVLAVDLYVVSGTAAVTPVAPVLTRNASVWELGLANLFIVKNATGIPQQRITDTRLDEARCGLVASVIGDTNTQTFYDQITADLAAFRTGREAEFDAWVAGIRNILNDEAAGNLLSLIAALQTSDANQNADITSLTTTVAQKLGWTQLWTGAWGGSGSANITVANLSNYTVLAFVVSGTVTLVIRGGSMFVSFQYCSAAGLMVRAYNIGSSGNVLNVNYAYQLLATGSTVTTTTLVNNHISEIYGVR